MPCAQSGHNFCTFHRMAWTFLIIICPCLFLLRRLLLIVFLPNCLIAGCQFQLMPMSLRDGSGYQHGWGGGWGVKGCLEFFRNFIRFGSLTPLGDNPIKMKLGNLFNNAITVSKFVTYQGNLLEPTKKKIYFPSVASSDYIKILFAHCSQCMITNSSYFPSSFFPKLILLLST